MKRRQVQRKRKLTTSERILQILKRQKGFPIAEGQLNSRLRVPQAVMIQSLVVLLAGKKIGLKKGPKGGNYWYYKGE